MFLYQRIWRRLTQAIHGWFHPRRTFHLNTDTAERLAYVARRTQHTPNELAERFVEHGVSSMQPGDPVALWLALTHREQEITALICLGYTNPEIGRHLSIAQSTVKSHVNHLFTKCGVTNRRSLRALFAEIDFTGWDQS